MVLLETIPIWGFPEMGVPQNRWFLRENPTKMDDLEVPPFMETPICPYILFDDVRGFPSQPHLCVLVTSSFLGVSDVSTER